MKNDELIRFVLAASTAVFVASGLIRCGSDTPTDNGTTTTTTAAQQSRLSSLTLNPSSVVGGNSVQGTVALSSAAPGGGATVALSSSNQAARVPANVSVTAGATSATFNVDTTPVNSPTDAVISASYNGVTQTSTLRVDIPAAPALEASFRVDSASRGQDACLILDDASVDCEFDGSRSSGNVATWEWTYIVGTKAMQASRSTPRYQPATDCDFLRGQTPNNSGGVQFIQMEVRLIVRNAASDRSPVAVNRNVRVFPNMNCGYGF